LWADLALADFSAAMSAPENIQKVVSMLMDPKWSVQKSGLKIISAWAEDGECPYHGSARQST
jgi:hypothetical protein